MRGHRLLHRRPVIPPAIDTLFDTSQCLNCTAPLTGPYCAQCGQKKAGRMGTATVRKEAWARFRWFEWDMVRNALRVLPQPGTVARDLDSFSQFARDVLLHLPNVKDMHTSFSLGEVKASGALPLAHLTALKSR